jgi:hypothetical protein
VVGKTLNIHLRLVEPCQRGPATHTPKPVDPAIALLIISNEGMSYALRLTVAIDNSTEHLYENALAYGRVNSKREGDTVRSTSLSTASTKGPCDLRNDF